MIKTLKSLFLWLILLCIGWVFLWSNNVFAQLEGWQWSTTAADAPEDSWTLATIDKMVRFLSRVWIVPASLAGQLMTNEIIYGKSFFMAETLFKFWQFIRNLALYWVGFLFLYKIWEMFAKWWDLWWLGNVVMRAWAAAILIPMSRWLVAWLVDLSIIATAAVSALPMEAMEQLRDEFALDGKVPISKVIHVKNYEIQPLSNVTNNTKTLEFSDLVPNGDSVAGTLIFMGAWVMRLDQALSLVESEDDNQKTANQISATFIRAIMTVMLVLPMIVLVVVNVIRLVYIWLRIVTVPFIILDLAFDWPLSNQEAFKLSNIMWLIFQPVVVVGTLGVWVLIIMWMYGALIGNEEVADQWMGELINVTIESDNSATVGANTNNEVIFDAEIFGQTADLVWWWVGRIIVSLFMIFLIWSLVKVGFSTSALTKSVSDGIYGFSEQMLSTIPVVPVPGMGLQSVSSLSRAKNDIKRNNPFEKKIRYDAENITNKLRGKIGVDEAKFGESSYDAVKGAALSRDLSLWKNLKKSQAWWKAIPLDNRIKSNIAQRVSTNQELAKNVFGFALPTSFGEVMKLWDAENDKDTTNWSSFRKAIDGILSNKIEENSVNEKTLRSASTNSQNSKLKPTYIQR